jgi:SSS family solute:Na+ symporter
VVIPGLVAVAVLPEFSKTAAPGVEYNSALILMMSRFLPNGVLGLAITALLASFMSGMAGNVTAFNTVWTYDIYASYIKKGQKDEHYLKVGKVTTVAGVLISIGTAYIVKQFPNLMDFVQLIFSFFNAPLFATFLLGMFWWGATPWGGFIGLLSGIAAAAGHYILYKTGVLHYASEMGANFYQAWWAWLTDFVVTIAVSLFTVKKDRESLKGLVYGLTPITRVTVKLWLRPEVWGSLALVVTLVLNIIFW